MDEKRCEYCHKAFTPTQDANQVYCSKTHATKAQAARHRIKEHLTVVGKCPTPYKRSYSSEEQAYLMHLPTNQRLYRCPCGALHGASIKDWADA